MNYLESVENDKELSGNESGGQSGNGTAMPRLNRSPMNSKYVALIVHCNSKKNICCFSRIAELACESPKKLAEQVVNLQFTVEEKERAIEVLRQAIDHQRKLSANFSQKFQKELNQRLTAQKTEYEATIMRHQNFIDQVDLRLDLLPFPEQRNSIGLLHESLTIESITHESSYQIFKTEKV